MNNYSIKCDQLFVPFTKSSCSLSKIAVAHRFAFGGHTLNFILTFPLHFSIKYGFVSYISYVTCESHYRAILFHNDVEKYISIHQAK